MSANVDGENLGPIITKQIDKASYIMTDESTVYPPITKDFSGHGTVNHSIEEYVRASFRDRRTAGGTRQQTADLSAHSGKTEIRDRGLCRRAAAIRLCCNVVG
jgi:hypothetical protein